MLGEMHYGISQEARHRTKTSHSLILQSRRLNQHENVEAIQLLDNMAIVCRLQRENPFELV
jgi:hypothetical protein